MIAYCGLHCDTCPIHLATLEENQEAKFKMRTKISAILHDRFSMDLRPEEITDCDGCTLESGRLFVTCRSCSVRNCARDRQHDSCAYCSKYVCDMLQEVFADQPEARSVLEKLRNN